MSVIHFDPYTIEENEAPEKTPCGVMVPEYDYAASASFRDVTCKRCIRMKDRLTKEFNQREKDITDQMGQMVEYFSSTESFGISDGEICRRNGCDGVMYRYDESNCSCHISPPCNNCVNAIYACDKCDETTEE